MSVSNRTGVPVDPPGVLAVGDEVWVHDGGRRAQKATVAKIGRTLVHIERFGRLTAFYRDDQTRRDGYSGYFCTQLQEDAARRRDAAWKRLRDFGVEIQYTHMAVWPTEHIELLATYVEKLRLGGEL